MCEKLVDSNTVYTQTYTELRRYRDYELTAAGWFATIQGVFANAVWHDSKAMVSFLLDHRFVQVYLSAFVYLLGTCGIIAVCYAKVRYEELSNKMAREFKDKYQWANLRTTKPFVRPFSWIVVVLGLIPIVHVEGMALVLPWRPICHLLGGVVAPVVLYSGIWAMMKYGFKERPKAQLPC